MSLADTAFINTCREILFHGTSTEDQNVRTKWEDTNTPAFTIKKFGVVNRYDLRKEFPAFTLRQTYIKSAIDEVLWIYQKKSNRISELKSHIWDHWADEDGTIGKSYGYQIGTPYLHHEFRKLSKEQVEELIEDEEE
ncbi:thymidylate synthase, partial [uncultured Streptococcus sp.]|uniref:thymidylate synthase n=1 Tax=uncultured Streptococcus sp. TaxID=83427 RepID=UPI002595D3EE